MKYKPENLNPRVHPFQWETRLAEFPTGTMDPRVEIIRILHECQVWIDKSVPRVTF